MSEPTKSVSVTQPAASSLAATVPLSESSVDPQPPPHDRLGRYIVLSELGAGAMGVVFSAYDPQLDRKVAIKLLKRSGWDDDAARLRLQREAQALARLAHRNVVAVYDVGVHDDQLFVAMELIAGQTFGEWMRSVEEPRPWPEVVSVFLEAGRGLAAAHGAGLIHRDFKPDNVMLGDDGHVRVMDFGLARAQTDPETATSELETPQTPLPEGDVEDSTPFTPALSNDLTQTGTMLGTPAYMSAEQLNRKPADARSDQFAFCVALYEALYGVRPFPYKSLIELVYSTNKGILHDPPKGSTVPAWLRKVVIRGLTPSPEDRHPSMQALLDALAADPAIKRRTRLRAAGLTAAILASTSAVVLVLRQPPPQACTGLDDKLAGVWDDPRRAEIEAAILRTDLSYAPSTWERVEAGLDTYAAQWATARTDACQATERGEQSSKLLDLRMACLDQRLQYLSTTIDVLAAADNTVVDNAVVAVSDLPRLGRCADVEALTAKQPPPEDPELAQRVAELEVRLVEASALRDSAQYELGLKAASAVVAEAANVAYEPLQASAGLVLGELQVHVGDYDAAAVTLAKAYDLALAQRMFDEAASTSALLMHMFGYYRDQHAQGRIWAAQADPLSRAVGTDEARALFLNNRGAMTMAEGKPELARADHQQALTLRQAALGLDHPDVAASLTHLGTVARDLGHGREALDYYGRALAIRERVFGPEHPQVAASLYNLGAAARTTGETAQATVWLEQALNIRRAALGPAHPYVASTLYQLGAVARLAGEYERSREYHEAAFEIWHGTLGDDHPDVAWGHSDLARGALDRGEFDLAQEHYAIALRIRESSLGPTHPLVASSLNFLGEIARERGAFDEARGHHTRALDVAKQASSAPLTAESLLGFGLLALAQQDPHEAVEQLERALLVGQSGPVAPASLDEIRFALARALWSVEPVTPHDRARAIALAHAAEFDHGEHAQKRRTERDAWLASHPG